MHGRSAGWGRSARLGKLITNSVHTCSICFANALWTAWDAASDDTALGVTLNSSVPVCAPPTACSVLDLSVCAYLLRMRTDEMSE